MGVYSLRGFWLDKAPKLWLTALPVHFTPSFTLSRGESWIFLQATMFAVPI